MMKNIKILLFALLSLAIVSCGEKDKDLETLNTIEILKADNEFSATAGEGTILLSSSEDNVQASTTATWLTIQKSNSSTVLFNVKENRALSNRAAIITLKSGSSVREVMVYQQGAILSIPNLVTMPIKKSTATIQYTVNLNVVPSVSIVDGNSWFSVRANEDGEIFIETKTDNMIERRGTIKVSTEWSSIDITVVQQGFIDKTSVYLFNGTLFSQDVIELNEEIISELEIVNPDSWYDAVIDGSGLKLKTKSQNDGTEPRTSNLTLKYGDISADILVAQDNNTYSEYIKGTWRMSFMNDLRSKDVIIRMSEKVADVLVLSITPGNYELNSPLEFDEATGILSLTPCEVGGIGTEGDLIYITLYNSGNSFVTKRDDVSIDLIFNRDYITPQLLFKDNGSWGTRIADGLMFTVYTQQGDYDAYYAVYPYITTFTKVNATE